jgi:hypothetical protein
LTPLTQHTRHCPTQKGKTMAIETRIDYGDESDDPVIVVLEQLAAADTEFDFSSMVRQWRRRGSVSPRQMGLIAWRLRVHDIEHEPGQFRVSTSTEKDKEALLEMPDWKRDQIAPYLSEEQKTLF